MALRYDSKELTLASISGGKGRKTDKWLLSYNVSRTPLRNVWELLTLRRGGTALRISSTLEKWNFRKKSKIGKGLETLKGTWPSRTRGALGINTREQQGSDHEVMY